jgi:hypothetical protein
VAFLFSCRPDVPLPDESRYLRQQDSFKLEIYYRDQIAKSWMERFRRADSMLAINHKKVKSDVKKIYSIPDSALLHYRDSVRAANNL